jgi:hypothetical protein
LIGEGLVEKQHGPDGRMGYFPTKEGQAYQLNLVEAQA